MEREQKIARLQELIDIFTRNIRQYKNPNYDEANTRTDFVDKFFELLDWDVRNEQGYSEDYREVVREDKIQIAGKPKAPDYGFKIGKERKFFLEVKRPSVGIKDDSSAHQLRSYANSAKLPLSILTDFEEFAIYDTRTTPKPSDKAGVERIFYCDYKDYIKHFDYIYDKFSKQAILKGSFDKYVSERKEKRGTMDVDSGFLSLIEEWRKDLAQKIALRNKQLDVYSLNYAVQKIIDRIIFLRIAEDRNIEEYESLKKITEQDGIYPRLDQWFERANRKYNSELFKSEEFLSRLTIDDAAIKDIIKSLYYPDCPYILSVMPLETLGNIYEQFLGKVIHLTPTHQARVEAKPEVRKAHGVYYTPKYIVDYIVENTVGELLKGKTPEEISALRVLDPACGSGSFLVGAYTRLLEYHLNYYLEAKNSKKALKESRIYQYSADTCRLTIEEKQRILLNNIYGVDIDPQAVEVTKLSLMLKLLENESIESAGEIFRHSDLKLLPDLSSNIKCGNSLIESDFYKDKNLSLFDKEEMRKINAFDWEKEFAEIMADGGFDAVIGNPPYVNAKALVELFEKERQYLSNSTHYSTLYQKWDYYIPFIEKGLRLLRSDGLTSMIIPYPFINQMYAKMSRKYIIENFNLGKLVDLSDVKVFKDATVNNCIFVISKSASKNKVSIFNIDNATNIFETYAKTYNELIADKNTYIWDLKKHSKIELNKDKITYIGNICFISIGMVLNADEKKAKGRFKKEDLISDEYSDIYIKKYIEAKDISRYSINKIHFLEWNTERVPYLIRRPTFPELHETEKILVTKIGEIKAIYDPEKLYCDQTIRILILWRLLKGIENNSINNSVKRFYKYPRHQLEKFSEGYDYKYILGILNSRMANYLLNQIRGVGNIDINPEYLKNITIPLINFSNLKEKRQHDDMVSMVKDMLSTQKQYHSAETEADKKTYQQKIELLDRQIDNLVYELYGLTEEEIEIVENS